MQTKTGPILRIIAEALSKIASVFDGKPAALDPCKCVKPAEVEKLATAAAHEETVRQTIAAELPSEDPAPPVVPPGAFVPPAPPAAEQPDPPPAAEPPASPPAPPVGAELDKDGLPWDQRIHAGSKALNVDGTWRLKRNTDPALIESVKAELKAAMSAPGPATAPPAAEQPGQASPPVEQPGPASPPPPPAADDLPPVSFAGFVQAITKKQAAGVLTVQEVAEACQKSGLASMPLLAARADLIPVVFEELRKIWVTRG